MTADVLSEEVILKWYKDSHSSRGWSVFMDQMKKFVEWLENADEGEMNVGAHSVTEGGHSVRSVVLGERAQHRALSDKSLWSIAGLAVNPWLQECGLPETTSAAVQVAISCAEEAIEAAETEGRRMSGEERKQVAGTVRMLLTAGPRLVHADWANATWRLTGALLEDDSDGVENKLLELVWRSCRDSRSLPLADTRVAERLLMRRRDLFLEGLERWMADEVSGDPLLLVVASSPRLFGLCMDFALTAKDREAAARLLSSVHGLADNHVVLYPPGAQHVAALLSVAVDADDTLHVDAVLSEVESIVSSADRDGDDGDVGKFVRGLLLVHRDWLRLLLRRSALTASRLHVDLMGAANVLTINEFLPPCNRSLVASMHQSETLSLLFQNPTTTTKRTTKDRGKKRERNKPPPLYTGL